MTTRNTRELERLNIARKTRGLHPLSYPFQDPIYKPKSSGIRKIITLVTVDRGEAGWRLVASRMRDAMKTEQDADKVFALYFSFINMQFPEVTEDLINAVEVIDYDLVPTPWRESAYVDMLRPDEDTEGMLEPEVAVYVGQLLLLPFKNLTRDNYKVYMDSRTAAMASKVGGHGGALIGVPVKLEVAVILGRKLGAMRMFKRFIISVMHDSTYKDMDGFREVFAYVTTLINWTGLVAYIAIRDELLRTNSPLINVAGLSAEWENFFHAIDTLMKYPYPQFFSIVADDGDLSALDVQNFPMLAAVAFAAAGYEMKHMANFAVDGAVQTFYEAHQKVVSNVSAPRFFRKEDHRKHQFDEISLMYSGSRTTLGGNDYRRVRREESRMAGIIDGAVDEAVQTFYEAHQKGVSNVSAPRFFRKKDHRKRQFDDLMYSGSRTTLNYRRVRRE